MTEHVFFEAGFFAGLWLTAAVVVVTLIVMLLVRAVRS